MDLVRTAAADQLRLDGIRFDASSPKSTSLDAVILLHGVGGNFYGGTLFNPLIEQLNALGVTAYRVNTRGHDGMFAADTTTGRRKFGAACEIVDECRLDIAAWLNHVAKRGHERIALVGHSLGAIKSVYSQAFEPDSRVAAIVAMSPPRLSYSLFASCRHRETFLASMKEAESLVAAGNGEQWFDAHFPVPLVISGTAYVDKYGPGERYDILRFLDRLRTPTLMMYGEREIDGDNAAFAKLPADIRALPNLPQSLDLGVIAQADHFYSGVREEAAKSAVDWLAKVAAA